MNGAVFGEMGLWRTFVLYSAVQGLVLAGHFLLRRSGDPVANRWLALVLLLISVHVGETVLTETSLVAAAPWATTAARVDSRSIPASMSAHATSDAPTTMTTAKGARMPMLPRSVPTDYDGRRCLGDVRCAVERPRVIPLCDLDSATSTDVGGRLRW